MKKTLILSLLASSLVLGGCFEKQPANQDDSQNPKTSENKSSDTLKTNPAENKGISLNELIGEKKDVKCEISTGNSQGNQKVEVYVDGSTGKIRMEMSIEAKNMSGETQNMKMSNIIDSEYYYTWGDALKNQGFKFNLKENQLDMERKVPLDCQDRTKDESLFELPKDIEFKESNQNETDNNK